MANAEIEIEIVTTLAKLAVNIGTTSRSVEFSRLVERVDISKFCMYDDLRGVFLSAAILGYFADHALDDIAPRYRIGYINAYGSLVGTILRDAELIPTRKELTVTDGCLSFTDDPTASMPKPS